MTYKDGWLLFTKFATKFHYTKKTVGDEAFTNRKGKTVRLKKVLNDHIVIWEEGIGIYNITESDFNDKG